MSSLKDATEALKNLNKIVNIVDLPKKINVKARDKEGIVFMLSSKEKCYIGYEYSGNLENLLKDLILRCIAFDILGVLYEDSYDVLKDAPVEFSVLLKVSVKRKNDLACLAKEEILRLGKDKCVNNLDPVFKESVKTKEISKFLYGKDIKQRYVDKYKKDKEEEMLLKYKEEGYNDIEGMIKLKAEIKDRLNELRKVKEELYNDWIIF